MTNFKIKRETKNPAFDYIVYATNYINPLENRSKLEQQLQKLTDKPASLLFDFLLCNGEEFNRFFIREFDGKQIIVNSVKAIAIESPAFLRNINQFFAENPHIMRNSVLTEKEKKKYMQKSE